MTTAHSFPITSQQINIATISERILMFGEYVLGFILSVIEFLVLIVAAVARPLIPFLAPLLLAPVVILFGLVILMAQRVTVALGLP